MRFFEIIFILSALSFLLIRKQTSYPLANMMLKVVIISTLFLHVVFEGVRYELILFLIGYLVILLPIKKFKKIRLTISSLLLLVSVTLFLLFPVYIIQQPEGSFEIGTKTYEVTDENRVELYGDGGFRRFNFQIFYPTDKKDAKVAPWLIDKEVTSEALSRDFGFPGFLLSQTKFVLSNSYLSDNVLDVKETYPIIIISHGWSGTKYLHTDLAESLTSFGYIVITIEHTYGSVATSLSDGIIYKQEDALTGFDDPITGLKSNTRLMMTYGLDVISTINYLTSLNDNEEDIFYHRLDLNSIGVVGHSTGGGGIIYAALQDSRIKALIGLDAWVEPIADILEVSRLSIPTLFLRSSTWENGPNNDVLIPMMEKSLQDSKLFQIDNTTHYDFAMVYMYTSLSKLMGFSGSIDTPTMTQILFDSHHAFFNHHLLNESYDNTWESIDEVIPS